MEDLKVGPAAASLLFGAAGARPAKTDKLHEAAQQFEAMMIGEMMKSVRQGSESGWLGSSGDDPSTDQAVEMAESHFAKALALSGGFGLSKVVEHSVHQEDQQTKSGRELRAPGQ